MRKAIIRAKIPFNVVYAVSEPGYPMPAIEGKMGMVYGWPMIKACFNLPID